MYLVSVYFDVKTENRIREYINLVSKEAQNYFMIENNVPPHITISALETLKEDEITDALDNVLSDILRNKIEWVTVGAFPAVIYIQPVLNEYLHNLSSAIYDAVANVPNTKVSKYYKPFSWLPHVTIAKQLSEEEMTKAFETLRKSFGMFQGEVVKIELAKKKPYRVIASWELKEVTK